MRITCMVRSLERRELTTAFVEALRQVERAIIRDLHVLRVARAAGCQLLLVLRVDALASSVFASSLVAVSVRHGPRPRWISPRS
jgi:hypothetical protein